MLRKSVFVLVLFVSAFVRADEPHWDVITAKGCTGEWSGLREWSAILWDVPSGVSWEDACFATPGTVNDVTRTPDACVGGLHEWGVWRVPDESCGPTTTNYEFIVMPPRGNLPTYIEISIERDDGSQLQATSIDSLSGQPAAYRWRTALDRFMTDRDRVQVRARAWVMEGSNQIYAGEAVQMLTRAYRMRNGMTLQFNVKRLPDHAYRMTAMVRIDNDVVQNPVN